MFGLRSGVWDRVESSKREREARGANEMKKIKEIGPERKRRAEWIIIAGLIVMNTSYTVVYS